jgi:hypothetical protein
MDLVLTAEGLVVAGVYAGATRGAVQLIDVTDSGLRPGQMRSLTVPLVDIEPVGQHLIGPYEQVVALTADLARDEDASAALRDSLDSYLGRDDWMISTGLEAVTSTVVGVIDVGGSSRPPNAGPHFEALVVLDYRDPYYPVVLSSTHQMAQNTIHSLTLVGGRLYTIEEVRGRCSLQVYDISGGLAARGAVDLPSRGMCGGGMRVVPTEGQRLAVSGHAVIVGYDPAGVYVIDVSDPAAPTVTGVIELPQESQSRESGRW